MKKLIYSLIITAILSLGLHTSSVMAQGSLEFNQVKLVTTSETVPTGKIWKVESIISGSELRPSFSACGSINSISTQIVLNGNTVYMHRAMHAHGSGTCSTGQGQSVVSTDVTKLPFWLPEGTTLAASTNVEYISVIEFNIIP